MVGNESCSPELGLQLRRKRTSVPSPEVIAVDDEDFSASAPRPRNSQGLLGHGRPKRPGLIARGRIQPSIESRRELMRLAVNSEDNPDLALADSPRTKGMVGASGLVVNVNRGNNSEHHTLLCERRLTTIVPPKHSNI